MQQKPFLRMNLQHFAEPEPTPEPEPDTNDGQPTPEPEPDTDGGSDGDEPTYTKADVEKLIKDRLERDRKAQEKKYEQQRLEEQEEYKQLYEQAQETIAERDKILAESKKTSLLQDAGYSKDQVEQYRKFIVGDTDDELEQAVTELKKDVPPRKSYPDPSTANPAKGKPAPKDAEEEGRKLFEELKQSGRVR